MEDSKNPLGIKPMIVPPPVNKMHFLPLSTFFAELRVFLLFVNFLLGNNFRFQEKLQR